MRKNETTKKFGPFTGQGRWDSLAGQPLGKMFAIAMVLGLLSTGIFMVLVPEEAGGDGGSKDNWILMMTDETPDSRAGYGLVYDQHNNWIILFGGVTSNGGNNETWMYDVHENTWTLKNPSNAPSPRWAHSMVYDSANKIVLLFGGYDGTDFFNDTWVYDAITNNWTEVSPISSPSERHVQAMAYDSVHKRAILFGGYDGNGRDDETWSYDGATNEWTMMTPSEKPSPRREPAMAFDPVNEKIVLFGGDDGSHNNETWIYDVNSDEWSKMNPSSGPSARDYHALTYDSDNDMVVLFGGYDGNTFLQDTWTYDVFSGVWTEMTPSNKPSPRHTHSLIYDSSEKKFVVFGGNDGSGTPHYLNDTWTYSFDTLVLNSSFSLTSSYTTYMPGDLVTLEYLFNGGQANITSLVRNPDGKVYLMETVETSHSDDITDNLIGGWSMNESSGQISVDEAGNGHDGTLGNSNSADDNDPNWTTGINGAALVFDGVNDYFNVNFSDSLQPTNEISVHLWFMTNDKTKTQSILSKTESGGYSLNIDADGNLKFWVQIDGSYYVTECPISEIENKEWNQLTGTYDGQNVNLYLNGILKDSVSATGPIDYLWDNSLLIGAQAGGGSDPTGEYFDGTIDEVRIFSRALSTDETSTLFNRTQGRFQIAQISFTLPDDAAVGNWTVYATNDVDDSTVNITFKVLPFPEITLSLGEISNVIQGETIVVDFTVTNGFDYSWSILLGLQLKDPSMHALRPHIEPSLTIDKMNQQTWQLSVKIPDNAEPGKYFLQGQMLTGWPDEGGYVLDYTTTSVTVIAG